jgi:hypothetical protein
MIDESKFQSLVTKASLTRIALGTVFLYWVSEAAWAIVILGWIDDVPGDWWARLSRVETSYPLLVLVTGILFVIWSHGAHANLAKLGREQVRHSNQATIWWWFVPIANLFMPFKVVFETVRGSAAALDDPSWRLRRIPPSAGWWAGLFLAGGCLSQLGGFLALTMTTEAGLQTATWVILAGALVMIGCSITAMALIAQVTESQARHADQLVPGAVLVGAPVD